MTPATGLSGASAVSTSEILADGMFNTHAVLSGKLALGLRTMVVALLVVTVTGMLFPAGHCKPLAGKVTVTASVKVMWMSESKSTLVAPAPVTFWKVFPTSVSVRVSAGVVSTVKVRVKSDTMRLGGSSTSVSATLAATTVRVQFAPGVRAEEGETSTLVTPSAGRAGVVLIATAPPQMRANPPVATSTASLKGMVMVGVVETGLFKEAVFGPPDVEVGTIAGWTTVGAKSTSVSKVNT